MADIQGLISDPDFLGLSVKEQKQLLTDFDPEFGNLSEKEVRSFLKPGKESKLTGAGSTLGDIGSETLTALPLYGAPTAYGEGLKTGQKITEMALGESLPARLTGGALGNIFGGAMALGTVFNPVTKGLAYYPQVAQASGEEIASSLFGGGESLPTQTLLGQREILPGLQASDLAANVNVGNDTLSSAINTILNTGTDIGTQVAKDPLNFAMLAAGLRSPSVPRSISNVPQNLRPGLSAAITESLRSSAEKNIQQALAPTTRETKAMTERITPEILDRPMETFSLTKEGLQKLTEAQKEKAGEAIEAFGELQGEVNPSRITASLEKLKDPYTVEGRVIDPVAVERIQSIQDVFNQYGDSISMEGLRSIRRTFDAQIRESKGFFKDVNQGTILDIKKNAANDIRGILAEANPDLAKLNKQFNFWSNFNDVITKTNERTRPQQGFMPNLATMTGAATGSGLADIVVRALIFRNIAKATQSPGWKLFSAHTKNAIAKALTEPDPQAVVNALKAGDKVLADQLRAQIDQVREANRVGDIETLTAISQGFDEEEAVNPVDLNTLIQNSISNP